MGRMHCIFNKASGIFVTGSFEKARTFDPATEVLLIRSEFPDRVNDRWDGAGDIRPATAQEKEDARLVKVDKQAKHELEELKVFRALIVWLAPLVGKSLAQARDEIKAIYRTLS